MEEEMNSEIPHATPENSGPMDEEPESTAGTGEESLNEDVENATRDSSMSATASDEKQSNHHSEQDVESLVRTTDRESKEPAVSASDATTSPASLTAGATAEKEAKPSASHEKTQDPKENNEDTESPSDSLATQPMDTETTETAADQTVASEAAEEVAINVLSQASEAVVHEAATSEKPLSDANEAIVIDETSDGSVAKTAPTAKSGDTTAAFAERAVPTDATMIEILDDDEEEENEGHDNGDIIQDALEDNVHRAKRQKIADELEQKNKEAVSVALAAYQSRASNLPDWMQKAAAETRGVPIQPGASLGIPPASAESSQTARTIEQMYQPAQPQAPPQPVAAPPFLQQTLNFDQPQYMEYPAGFTPTWQEFTPFRPKPPPAKRNQRKRFMLSLLNVNEFTITGLPVHFDEPPTSISGLRVPIKQISRDHGKAVYERDKEGGGGKWRIPLGAYHAFVNYLTSDPNCYVQGISEMQLKIASLERARQEKGYPSVDKLIKEGVPPGLAKALAPFQRGGVDFVLEKSGRALVADGKYSLSFKNGCSIKKISHRAFSLY